MFAQAGIPVLPSFLVQSQDRDQLDSHISQLDFPVVAKAQTLSGKRGKRGLVQVIKTPTSLVKWIDAHLNQPVEEELISQILVEQAVDISQELFVSITYSTKTRGPVLLFSLAGGMEVEDMVVKEYPLRLGADIPDLLTDSHWPGTSEQEREKIEAKIWQVIQTLWQLFQEKDLFLAEINPLAVTKTGAVFALDAKVVTDDAAAYRQNWQYPERNMFGRSKSWAELEAEKIDAQDHRGAVGRVYLDLVGDIGVIAAGGGASLVAMDALVSYGLTPANYTEFSGNPPQWKVKRLTEIVLAKAGLRGAILIGGKANFTDQVETLSGFLEALEAINPQYPIVVRRDGPRMNEAKELLEKAAKKHQWQLFVYDSETSIIDAVKKLVELVK